MTKSRGTANIISAVSAKGDLIVGTADTVVQKLTVGAEGRFLLADPAASTGLAWKALTATTPLSYDSATQTLSLPDSFIDQTIKFFETATQRDIDLPSPVEGEVVYVRDNNFLQAYNGASWDTVAFSANVVSKTNGTVTTANTSSTVVRNITLSTSTPSGGIDGDVWLQYTP
jgi:hypothetical protein